MFINLIKAAALLPVAALLVAVPAAADPVSVKVSYAGLDLNSQAGASALDRRISAAVASMCAVDNADLSTRNQGKSCIRAANASAAAEKNSVMALARSANDRQQFASR